MSEQKNIFFCFYWGKTTCLLSLPLYRRSNEFCKYKWAFYFLKHVLEIDVFISTEEIGKFIHAIIFWNFKFWLICIQLAVHAQHFDILMTAWASITACPQHKAQSRGHFTYKFWSFFFCCHSPSTCTGHKTYLQPTFYEPSFSFTYFTNISVFLLEPTLLAQDVLPFKITAKASIEVWACLFMFLRMKDAWSFGAH